MSGAAPAPQLSAGSAGPLLAEQKANEYSLDSAPLPLWFSNQRGRLL